MTKIVGTGSCLPKQIASNTYLSQIVETTDEWICSRTGIEERRIAIEETTVSMAMEACKGAMEEAGLLAEEIQLIIVATVSPDDYVPSTACNVQKELGAINAVAFDLNAACSGFIFALNTAHAYFEAGMYTNALIVGVETLSKIINWEDRGTCVLFGDGAGAVVVKSQEGNGGIIASIQGSDGARGGVLTCKNRDNNNPFVKGNLAFDYLGMDGQEVFKFAVKKVPECMQELLQKANVAVEEVDCFLLHQANLRIINSIAKKMKVPIEKFPANVQRYGNTSAASIPILLDEVNKEKKLKKGDKILMAGFGAGLTWGAVLLEW